MIEKNPYVELVVVIIPNPKRTLPQKGGVFLLVMARGDIF